MKIGLNIGHFGTKGAIGILDETICATEVYNELVPLLKKAGHTVVPCNVAKQPDYVSATKYANTQDIDLLISIHFNATAAHIADGTMVLHYPNSVIGSKYAEKISESISNRIGTKDLGAFPRTNLYILNNSKMPAVLVECLFVDNKTDTDKYNAHKIAVGIAEVFGYKEQTKPNQYSYDDTVEHLIADGITTTENMAYWEKVLDGREAVNLDYIRAILDKYHKKVI